MKSVCRFGGMPQVTNYPRPTQEKLCLELKVLQDGEGIGSRLALDRGGCKEDRVQRAELWPSSTKIFGKFLGMY